ncbi:MAG TPA: universal stress protein [Candidatus Dormibacteraeota bacterium]|nr:universal stress protein [Candidatus Dormibacteraeota bacterium]
MPATKARTRVELRNILYATDFSPMAEVAASYAAELARRYGSKVFALHVRPLQSYGMAPPESWAALKEAADFQAKEQAAHLTELFRGVQHQAIVAEGGVWEILSSFIKEQHIDLVVMGTHGREGLGKLFLGSVTENVLRRAPCPVLTIGPHVEVEPALAIEMKRILFATDFSRASQAAAPYAVSLAQENQAHLDMLHVVENRKVDELVDIAELIQATTARMQHLLPPEAELWCEPAFLVEAGHPAEQVIKAARERKSDVIVVGVRQVTNDFGAADHLPWHTAHKIIAGAPCPVLTVRG